MLAESHVFTLMQDRPNPLSYDQRLLWCAVLEQAVEDFRGCCDQNNDKNSPSHRRMRHEQAAAWFKSDRSEINSFIWICDLLGLDAVAIREKLLAEKKNDLQPLPPNAATDSGPDSPGLCVNDFENDVSAGVVNVDAGKKEKVMEPKSHCMIEGCTMKRIAQGLCIKHYDKWRRGGEEVVKAKGGPFMKVRLPEGRVPLGRKKSDSSAPTDRSDSPVIAPGSQVVKRVFERIKEANGGNGQLQKAVDLLVAHGYLSKSKLDAALELVRD